MYGDLPRTEALAREALKGLPEGALVWRGNTLVQLGVAYALNGDMKAASRTFAEAQAVSESADNAYTVQIVSWRSARLQVAQGRLRRAAGIYRKLLHQASEHVALGQLPVAGYCHIDLGDLLREWNELGTAAQHLEAGIERIERAGSPTILLDGYIALARLRQALGDDEGAAGALRRARWLTEEYKLPARFVFRLGAHEARLWLAQGDLESATRWARDLGLDPDEVSYLREPEHLALARLLIAQGDPAGAQRPLGRLLAAAELGGRLKTATEIRMLQAMALRRQGADAGALATLRGALELAQPEGLVRTFVDEGAAMAELLAWARKEYRQAHGTEPAGGLSRYLDALLVASRGPSAPRRSHPEVRPGTEPLSDRELEVLRLVAAGFKNQEVADELYVVVGTVKAHLNSIYRKLGVRSRIQAVSQVRELGLLAGGVGSRPG